MASIYSKKGISDHLAGIGVLFIFLGFFALFFNRFGSQIAYTHTYKYVTQYIDQYREPYVDFEFITLALSFIILLFWFVMMPNVKGSVADNLLRKQRVRVFVLILGAIIGNLAVYYFLISNWLTVSSIRSIGFWSIVFPVLIGTVCLTALILAAFPQFFLKLNIWGTSWAYRICALVLALFTMVMVVLMVDSQFADPPDQQILSSQLTPQSNQTPSHFLFFTLSPKYKKLSVNETVPIEVIFKALDPQTASQTGVTGAYPVSLDPNKEYAVSVNIKSVGFEVESPSTDLLEPRKFDFNSELKWLWLIAPMSGREGTTQQIIFEAFIHDASNNNVLVDSPYVIVTLDIATPLGLPPWLVSPQTSLGALIIGAISLIGSQVLSKLKKDDDKEKDKIEVARIKLPDDFRN